MALFGRKGEGGSNPGREYLNTVYALARSARAWRLAAICMAALVAVMGVQTIMVARSMPVRLVPYDYAINAGIEEVSELGEVTANYLALIAGADVALLNNWTPETVKTQYRRFLNRCGPELYAAEQVNLLNLAEDQKRGVRVQAFFPRDVTVQEGNIVLIDGRLKQWAGRQLMNEEAVTFKVVYRFLRGVPYIHRFGRVGKDDGKPEATS